MKCYKCGCENPEGTDYCQNCGKKIPKINFGNKYKNEKAYNAKQKEYSYSNKSKKKRSNLAKNGWVVESDRLPDFVKSVLILTIVFSVIVGIGFVIIFAENVLDSEFPDIISGMSDNVSESNTLPEGMGETVGGVFSEPQENPQVGQDYESLYAHNNIYPAVIRMNNRKMRLPCTIDEFCFGLTGERFENLKISIPELNTGDKFVGLEVEIDSNSYCLDIVNKNGTDRGQYEIYSISEEGMNGSKIEYPGNVVVGKSNANVFESLKDVENCVQVESYDDGNRIDAFLRLNDGRMILYSVELYDNEYVNSVSYGFEY